MDANSSNVLLQTITSKMHFTSVFIAFSILFQSNSILCYYGDHLTFPDFTYSAALSHPPIYPSSAHHSAPSLYPSHSPSSLYSTASKLPTNTNVQNVQNNVLILNGSNAVANQSRPTPTVGVVNGPNGFEELYRWRQISYAPLDQQWSSNQRQPGVQNDLSSNEIMMNYIAYNNLPMGATRFRDRLFITLPRRRPGMPATIAYIRLTSSPPGSSPSLQAYPTFRVNQLHPNLQADSNRIVSVYRSRVDECNRLWFVDTGNLEYPNNATQIQPASIWIFDLETDRPIRRFEIPTSLVRDGRGIASITPDIIEGACNNAFAYFPDLFNYRLHVYSLQQNRMWSFTHNYFGYDPIRGDFSVAGVSYQWNDGIFSVTLGNVLPNGYRTAFFHSMASVSEFAVSTQILRNETASTRSFHGADFMFLGHRGDLAQSAMHAFDSRTGVIFFSQVATNAIACWNTARPLTLSNIGIIARDNNAMIYPSDINVDADGVVYVMTNNLPLFNYAQVNANQFNYRVWRRSTADAIRGTVCDVN